MIKSYLKNIKYILEHKKNVFIQCWKEGLYIHAFTHDMSKFLPSEFIPYTIKFFTDYPESDKERIEFEFERSFEKHFKRNKHHWKHWLYDWKKYEANSYHSSVSLEDCKLTAPDYMSIPYLIQMICDWKAMSMKFGGTAQEYYMKNYDKIQLHPQSRIDLEFELGLLGEGIIFGMNWKQCCENWGITMEEDLKNLGYIK